MAIDDVRERRFVVVLCRACAVALVVLAQDHPMWAARATTPTRVLEPGETLAGHVTTGTAVWLITEPGEIVEIAADGHVSRRRLDGLRPGEQVWGLAAAPDASLWTIVNNRELVTIRDGRIGRRQRLAATHFGLFGAFSGLLVQALPLVPGGAVLRWMAGANEPAEAIGQLRVRDASAGPRVLTWGRSFAACGIGTDTVVPCWNLFDAIVDPVTRRTPRSLVRLADVASSLTVDLEGPVDRLPRPIRDAAWLPNDTLVVLTAGPGRATSQDVRELRRYGPDGRLLGARVLDVACRAILQVTSGRLTLLARAGHLVEVAIR